MTSPFAVTYPSGIEGAARTDYNHILGQKLGTVAICVGRIYVVDADGGNLRQLTGGLDQGQPVWSPDGRRIAFMDYATLAIMDADGSHLIKLLDHAGNILGLTPVWSPDSKRLIFSNGHTYPLATTASATPNAGAPWPAASSFSAYVVNADGSGVVPIGGGDYDPLLAWSPDSRLIVLSGVLFNADGSGGQSFNVRFAQDGPHSWAPDGHRLVFSRKAEGHSDLYIVTVSH